MQPPACTNSLAQLFALDDAFCRAVQQQDTLAAAAAAVGIVKVRALCAAAAALLPPPPSSLPPCPLPTSAPFLSFSVDRPPSHARLQLVPHHTVSCRAVLCRPGADRARLTRCACTHCCCQSQSHFRDFAISLRQAGGDNAANPSNRHGSDAGRRISDGGPGARPDLHPKDRQGQAQCPSHCTLPHVTHHDCVTYITQSLLHFSRAG
jgi:hypothetical protein